MFSKYLIIGAVVLALSGAGVLYFKWSQNQIAELNGKVSAYAEKAATLEASLNDTLDHINRMQARMQTLNKNMRNIEEETSDLKKVLAKHDLERLAAAKPNLIENRANEATKKLFRELEEISRR